MRNNRKIGERVNENCDRKLRASAQRKDELRNVRRGEPLSANGVLHSNVGLTRLTSNQPNALVILKKAKSEGDI